MDDRLPVVVAGRWIPELWRPNTGTMGPMSRPLDETPWEGVVRLQASARGWMEPPPDLRLRHHINHTCQELHEMRKPAPRIGDPLGDTGSISSRRAEEQVLLGCCLDVDEAVRCTIDGRLAKRASCKPRDRRELRLPLSHVRTLDSRALEAARAHSKCNVNMAAIVVQPAVHGFRRRQRCEQAVSIREQESVPATQYAATGSMRRVSRQTRKQGAGCARRSSLEICRMVPCGVRCGVRRGADVDQASVRASRAIKVKFVEAHEKRSSTERRPVLVQPDTAITL
ncbi:hypothetical protein B0T16DRAFT_116492 [Cercophora newfieldiana]|uniref:Uncharacterized protein n=1 Tax=Cercophora newfieldiana TaxID=92897 RepID=A0AA39Y9H6_9PEZI|nr:hypothetical protein B0T16DRAFT_116492 [Cercophora newfieldiana]